MAKNYWTREETIVAFNVYCKIQFKDSSKTNPTIIKYAKIIGRSPSALNMKVGNFGRLDPELKKRGIVGLRNGSKLEEVIWKEFHGNWEGSVYESQLLLAMYENKSIEEVSEIDLIDMEFPKGKERETVIKRRVNQSFFRSTILSSYNLKCAITGLPITELLVASHIVPWAKDENNRLNPRNGICLNSIHDKAFDEGYLTITTDYKVKVSPILKTYNNDNSISDLLLKYDNQKIILPDKFFPAKEFLDYHNTEVFKK
jgi:putative restriction endonuclease